MCVGAIITHIKPFSIVVMPARMSYQSDCDLCDHVNFLLLCSAVQIFGDLITQFSQVLRRLSCDIVSENQLLKFGSLLA